MGLVPDGYPPGRARERVEGEDRVLLLRVAGTVACDDEAVRDGCATRCGIWCEERGVWHVPFQVKVIVDAHDQGAALDAALKVHLLHKRLCASVLREPENMLASEDDTRRKYTPGEL